MKIKQLSFFFIICMSMVDLNAQQYEDIIKGKWVLVEKKSSVIENKGFSKYTFLKDNKLFISFNPYDRGIEGFYKIKNEVLSINYTKFLIEKINDTCLVLLDMDDGISLYIYERPKIYIPIDFKLLDFYLAIV